MSLAGKFARSFGRVMTTNALQGPRSIMTSSVMHAGGSRDCKEDESPRCGSAAFKKDPCATSKKKDSKKGEDRPPLKSMWENPECCNDPCKDVMPRFDDLYYKISDKAKRKYQQTWNECPERKIVKKIICEFEKVGFPKLEKRPRKQRPKTATAGKECGGDANLMKCLTAKANSKCAKITLPGCKAVRDPPICKKIPGPSDCKKVCAPYPSYSECKRDPPRPKHPNECHCHDQVFMCDVYAEIRRRATLKK